MQGRSSVKRLLTDGEEESLVDYLFSWATKSCKDVLLSRLPARMIQRWRSLGGGGGPFPATHPEVTLRQAEPLSYARTVAESPNTINRYFSLLEETIKINGLSQCPGQIINCNISKAPTPQHS